ncbi:hypothetical protein BCR34DRAFT_561592 [Clohesyomyces aquaticus]|uniref:Uncharacterized protein n=1 Tax=Clohesyomyces aquaticus TaxID=1231657 RepID=A0A1Y1ZUJ6_9PLEO|nr:hypothetical protein BCR34DRAFT_561592 [Clohesyomyces aquaticus]
MGDTQPRQTITILSASNPRLQALRDTIPFPFHVILRSMPHLLALLHAYVVFALEFNIVLPNTENCQSFVLVSVSLMWLSVSLISTLTVPTIATATATRPT